MTRLACVLVTVVIALAACRVASAQDVVCEYDPAGRLVRIERDSEWAIEYDYDAAGNVLRREVILVQDPEPDQDGGLDGGEDGGVDAGEDAGPDADGGGDTGIDGGQDGGADAASDPGPDGGGPADEDEPGDGDGGCGCQTGSRPHWPAGLLLLVGVLGALWCSRRRGARLPGVGASAGLVGLLVFGATPDAAALTVCPEGCQYTTIEEALANIPVPEGGEVLIEPGVYNESDLRIPINTTVRSSDPLNPGATVVDGGGSDTVFVANYNTTIQGLTIQNGVATPEMVGGDRFGGGISHGSDKLTVRNCILRNNHADQGGAIFAGSDTTIIDTIIQNNTAESVGGGVFFSGPALVLNSKVLDNVITSTDVNQRPAGGGLYMMGGTLMAHNTIVSGNQVVNEISDRGAWGGGISGSFISGTRLYLLQCTIDDNSVYTLGGDAQGGGISLLAPITMLGGVLSNNWSTSQNGEGRGGGMQTSGSDLQMRGVTISGNYASSLGGGIYQSCNNGKYAYSGCNISGNHADTNGGGMYCQCPDLLYFQMDSPPSGNNPNDLFNCDQCNQGDARACQTGLPAPCNTGTQSCLPEGVWGQCVLDNQPETEVCDDNVDNDCDGRRDADDSDCEGATTTGNHKGSGKRRDPVDTYTGELFMAEPPDLFLGGPLPLYFSRYYASGLDTQGITGSLGTNWRHNFEWTLTDLGETVEIIDEEGRSIAFHDQGLSTFELEGRDDIPFELYFVDGFFHLLDPGNDRIYIFDPAGVLVQIRDHHGNALDLTWSGGELVEVDDGLGRCLTFTTVGGRITGITDGVRAVGFAYTGSDLTSATDTLGDPTSYAYDAGGLMTARTRPEGNTPYTQTWDADGRVQTQTDALLNTHTLAYDDASGITTLTDPLGQVRNQVHGMGGYLTEMSSPDGLTVYLGYDNTGRRSSLTDRLGDHSSITHHEPSGKIASITDADGQITRFDYVAVYSDLFPRWEVSQISHPDGTVESFEYDEFGDLATYVDQAGERWTFTFNQMGQRLTTTNPAGGVTTWTYNPDGTMATELNSAGDLTTYGYDGLGRLVTILAADGTSRSLTWDDGDNLLTLTDPRGNTTTYSYDRNGNLATIEDRLGNLTTFQYDDMDRLASWEDPETQVVLLGYDEMERLSSVTNQAGNSMAFHYDSQGRMTAIEDAAGLMWSRTWDAEGILTTASDPLANTWTLASDSMGWISGITSPQGHTENYGYDALGRLISVSGPEDHQRMLTLDARGDVVTDVEGGASAAYTRDALGSITAVTDPNGNDWSYGFDPSGRLISTSDPLGNTHSFSYGSMHRPDLDTLPGGLGTVTRLYDDNGNLTSAQYTGGPELTFGWDEMDRLTSADDLTLARDATGRIADSNGIAITREASGRIETVTFDAGLTVTYQYGPRNELVSVTDWLGGETTFSYDDAGRRIGMSRPNGVDVSWTYNQDGDLTGIDEADAGGQRSSIALTRDGLGRTTAVARDLPAPVEPAARLHTFAFDSACQVDAWTYDALGRLADDGSRTYTWDLASRLVQIEEAGATTSFTYDGLGYRSGRSAGGVSRTYVWNHALGLPSVSIIRETGADLRYFVHTPDGMLLYSIEAVGAGDTRRYYHFDEMGNTLYLTDSAGAQIAAYAYLPYGVILAEDGVADNPFTWQGAYGVMREGSSGLYYMRARYYDSTSMRFLSRDPITSVAPKSVNPYQYALGNPLLVHDPTGAIPSVVGAERYGGERAVKLNSKDVFDATLGTYLAAVDDLVIGDQAYSYQSKLEAAALNPKNAKNAKFMRHFKRFSRWGKRLDKLGKVAGPLQAAIGVGTQFFGYQEDQAKIRSNRKIMEKLITENARAQEDYVRKLYREKNKSPEWLFKQLRAIEANYNAALKQAAEAGNTEGYLSLTKRSLKMLGSITPVPERVFDRGFQLLEDL